MPRFFFHRDALVDNTLTLSGESASHILRSLRMAVGEHLTLCDGEGLDYHAVITSATKDSVTLSVEERLPSKAEPPYRITLWQCLPKGEKFETIIQKAVECGICEIVPVQSSRCIAKIKKEEADKKLARFNKIAEEAAKQSGRGILPKVLYPVSYKDAVVAMKQDDLSFLCYENEDKKTLPMLLRETLPPRTVSFLVGSEGGLSEEEVALAKENGILSLSLGERILRTETAAPFVLAVLSAFFEL